MTKHLQLLVTSVWLVSACEPRRTFNDIAPADGGNAGPSLVTPDSGALTSGDRSPRSGEISGELTAVHVLDAGANVGSSGSAFNGGAADAATGAGMSDAIDGNTTPEPLKGDGGVNVSSGRGASTRSTDGGSGSPSESSIATPAPDSSSNPTPSSTDASSSPATSSTEANSSPAASSTDSSSSPTTLSNDSSASHGGVSSEPEITPCSNDDFTTIPIEASRWVRRECNDFDIQGVWYCYDDGVNPSGCENGVPIFDVDNVGVCLTGSTTFDPSNEAWGAGIGLGLNIVPGPGPTDYEKLPYDASAHDLQGLELTVEGDVGNAELRVIFRTQLDDTKVEPQFTPSGIGAQRVPFAKATIPEWAPAGAGQVLDPAQIYDVQVQVIGEALDTDYHFCITELTPIKKGTDLPPSITSLDVVGVPADDPNDAPPHYFAENQCDYDVTGDQQVTAADVCQLLEFSVDAFDDQGGLLEFRWEITGDNVSGAPLRTTGPTLFTLLVFGTYELDVIAIDSFGQESEPYHFEFAIGSPT